MRIIFNKIFNEAPTKAHMNPNREPLFWPIFLVQLSVHSQSSSFLFFSLVSFCTSLEHPQFIHQSQTTFDIILTLMMVFSYEIKAKVNSIGSKALMLSKVVSFTKK